MRTREDTVVPKSWSLRLGALVLMPLLAGCTETAPRSMAPRFGTPDDVYALAARVNEDAAPYHMSAEDPFGSAHHSLLTRMIMARQATR